MAEFGTTDGTDIASDRGMADAVEVRAIGLDDFSGVRHVHASSFKNLANAWYPEEEVEAFAAFVSTPGYVDLLRGENLLGGFLGGDLVATAGWTPADDNGLSARVRSVFVRPLFTGLGIGRRMALEAESWARRSGFKSFGARVTLNATGFFETLGYEVTSHGVYLLPHDRGLPVCFMRKSDHNLPLPLDVEVDAH